MEKKLVDLLSMLNFNDLSEKELKEIQHKVTASLQVINGEKARRKRIKDEYAVEYPEPEYKPNYHAFYTRMKEAAAAGESISSEFIEQIDKNTQIKLAYNYSEIYRCPICGELTLQCVIYDEDDCTYTISCYHCDWELPKKYVRYYETDAWRSLHEYLKMEGYVPESCEFKR